MITIEVLKDFAHSPNGWQQDYYTAGQVVDVSDECARCAIAEQWARVPGAEPAVVRRNRRAAPENAAAAVAPETK